MRAGHDNQDSNAVARDQVYVVRDTVRCPNKGAGTKPAQPPSTSAAAG